MAEQLNPEVGIGDTEPGQVVARTVELIDKIFGFLKPKDLVNVRKVNRQWRSISEMYIKRRMEVFQWIELQPSRTKINIRFNKQVQHENLLNNKYQVPEEGEEIELGIAGFCDRRLGPPYLVKAPVGVAIILNLPWISRVTILNLSYCLTIDEWMRGMGSVIFTKFASLVSLKIGFSGGRNSVLPLCYKELVNQTKTNRADPTAYDTLRRVRFDFLKLSERPRAGFFDRTFWDIFLKCPELATFEFNGIFGESALIWVSRSTNRSRPRAEVMDTWTAGIEYMKFELVRNPGWKRFLELLLDQAQELKKLWLPFRSNLLSYLDVSKTSMLEKLCLFSDVKDEPLAIKTLISKPMFQNLTSLYWAYKPYHVVKTWKDISIDGPAAFPNLKILQLHRKRDSSTNDDDEAGPEHFRVDDWIRLNLNKLAPKVGKLIVHIYDCCRTKTVNWRDFLDVMSIVRSFDQLRELFLINSQNFIAVNSIAEDEAQVIACLKGLKEVTVAAKDSQLLLGYARILLRAAGSAESTIEKLGFFTRDEDVDGLRGCRIINENQLEVGIPATVQVTSGRWDVEREVNASIEIDAYRCPVEQEQRTRIAGRLFGIAL